MTPEQFVALDLCISKEVLAETAGIPQELPMFADVYKALYAVKEAENSNDRAGLYLALRAWSNLCTTFVEADEAFRYTLNYLSHFFTVNKMIELATSPEDIQRGLNTAKEYEDTNPWPVYMFRRKLEELLCAQVEKTANQRELIGLMSELPEGSSAYELALRKVLNSCATLEELVVVFNFFNLHPSSEREIAKRAWELVEKEPPPSPLFGPFMK